MAKKTPEPPEPAESPCGLPPLRLLFVELEPDPDQEPVHRAQGRYVPRVGELVRIFDRPLSRVVAVHTSWGITSYGYRQEVRVFLDRQVAAIIGEGTPLAEAIRHYTPPPENPLRCTDNDWP